MATSKLDSLSREDLIRFAKKQLVNSKEHKEEIAKLKVQLNDCLQTEQGFAQDLKNVEEEKSRLARRVEELEAKQSFLIEATSQESNDYSATELVLKARITELEDQTKDVTFLKTENSRLATEMESQRAQFDSLTSLLENTKTELATLREKQSTAEVFSLEVEDYAKKVRSLEKDLAALKITAASSEMEVATLKKSLDEARTSQFAVDDECRKFQQEAQTLRNQLCESQVGSSQLKTEISSLNDQLNGLLENQGSERLGLGREIAASQQRITALEEVSEALREENVRLKAENSSSVAALSELETEYDHFKSRARFVLQQKATTVTNEELEKNKSDELEGAVARLREKLDAVKKDLSVKHDDCEKYKERTTSALADLETKRKEADELQTSLSNTMDELRLYRIKFETVVSQLTETSQRLGETDSEKATLRQEILKAEALLKFERNRFEETLENMTKQLNEEMKRREELSAQLDDSRREHKTIRMPPVAAVQPHICEVDFAGEASVRRASPDNTMNPTQEDRSLEDVLFGETCDDSLVAPSIESIPELIEEISRLRKQAEHTTSLLNESEVANGRLIEQTRCLKEEIRRLERNEERKSHLENVEYLKNVIVKFLTPEKVAAEKRQLVPILNTMLRLSDDELQILRRAAENDASSASADASWGSYLKWGGIS